MASNQIPMERQVRLPALARIPPLAVYAATILLSSFLSFLLQPVIAKRILPWFGGTANVWIVCLLFFQIVLLGGYFYAHAVMRLPARFQAVVHLGLLAASLAFLPLDASPEWKPSPRQDPAWRILLLLCASAGLPYFALTTTSPLLQAWYAGTVRRAIPYRLFALSNLSSLLALLAYPVAIEPRSALGSQMTWWSAAYVAFAILAAISALMRGGFVAPARAASARAPESTAVATGWRQPALWAVLAGFGCAMQIAITNHLGQSVASVPFLWVLPLGLYLLTFILCFDGEGWYWRNFYRVAFAAAVTGMGYSLLFLNPGVDVRWIITLYAAGLFIVCMFFHGELALRKPPAGQLTLYYLMISSGGAAGGLLAGFAAPNWFTGYFEFPVFLALAAMCALMLHYRGHWITDIAWTAVAVAVAVMASTYIQAFRGSSVDRVRNFYGGLRITSDGKSMAMIHGTTNHGAQFTAPERRQWPTGYYGQASGAGLALAELRRGPLRAGIVGLGAGTLAAYAQPGDRFRFYEINPLVEALARKHFTFLADCGAACDVVLGDGRLSLEREASQELDLLAIDAFSGDSIPTHLMTREAVRAYLRHLKPEGVLAFHISNWSFDLAPVVARIASAEGLTTRLVASNGDPDRLTYTSYWVLAGRDLRRFERLSSPLPADQRRPWTDDFSNLLEAVK
ncbi:MAG: fused MFS/spermidine synthase [Bryobacteraceae bacterium]|nr:fused MFS/spermidine synthase [Bryobacteraceae bacterium]